MRLTATMFITVDGVVQGGGGPDEDTSGGFTRGGWMPPYAHEEGRRLVVEWFARADAFLLGRRTFEIFAGYWPRVSDENPIAAAFNRLPKYVVSRTLTSAPAWQPTTIISDVVREVAALKQQPGRDLQVHGSPTLLRSLLAHGLVDELRLTTVPVVLGSGRRLFDDGSVATALQLIDVRTTPTGVIVATYRPDGPPKQGSFPPPPAR